MQPVVISVIGRDFGLADSKVPLALDELLPGGGDWEVEIGFGKGRFLLQRARRDPAHRFLGIEMAFPYHRIACQRRERGALTNLALIRGEALFVLSAVLPTEFAAAVHVYFPDPWPKQRHQKRRFFDPQTVDLVLGLLQPGGRLYFATDYLEYGDSVLRILRSHPLTRVRVVTGSWPEGPRTNYEIKYGREGRPILRLEVERVIGKGMTLHPDGSEGVLVANVPRPTSTERTSG